VESTALQVSIVVAQVASGIGLAACAGLRAFLPLLVVGLAGRAEWIPLTGKFEWLASTPALVVFGVAVLVEILADKVPVVDHFLDSIQAFVKPIAGAVLAASVLAELTPLQASVVGLVTGGTVAGTIHLTKANLRLVSSATTAGLANPVLSVIEDVGAFLGSVLALVVPVLVVLLLVGALTGVWVFIRRGRRRA
jgi:hypothetical protein